MPVPWKTRDTIGCLLVPLLSSLVAALTSLPSPFADLFWNFPGLRPNDPEGSVNRYLVTFTGSAMLLFPLYSTLRLTTFARLARLKHKRTLFLTLTGGPALAVAVTVTFAVTATATGIVSLSGWTSISDWTASEWTVFGFIAGVAFVSGSTAAFLTSLWFLPEPGPLPKHSAFLASTIGLMALVGVCTAICIPWERSLERAGCLINLRNVQQAMRSYQGMNAKIVGSPLPRSLIIGPGNFLELEPFCPGGGTYTWEERIPDVGTLMIRCSNPDHLPDDYEGW